MSRRAPRKTTLDPEESLKHLLEECRMVLPGIQALFGFQLIAVFNKPFWDLLGVPQRLAHLAAICLMALAIGLVLAPASYHRLAEPDAVTQRYLRTSSRFITFGMAALMGGMLVDIFLIAQLLLPQMAYAVILTAAMALFFTGLWYLFPLARARQGG
jgi:hypothetical protein